MTCERAERRHRVTSDQAISHELSSCDAVAELRNERAPERGMRRCRARTPPAGTRTGASASHAWVSSLARTPTARLGPHPRLPLELAFIAGAAVLAGVADLAPGRDRRRDGRRLGDRRSRRMGRLARRPHARAGLPVPDRSGTPAAASAVKADPTWFTPPVEHTLLASVDDQATAIAKLPPRRGSPRRRPSGTPEPDPESSRRWSIQSRRDGRARPSAGPRILRRP